MIFTASFCSVQVQAAINKHPKKGKLSECTGLWVGDGYCSFDGEEIILTPGNIRCANKTTVLL